MKLIHKLLVAKLTFSTFLEACDGLIVHLNSPFDFTIDVSKRHLKNDYQKSNAKSWKSGKLEHDL